LLSAQEQPKRLVLALGSLAWQQELELPWRQRPVFSRLVWRQVLQLSWQRQAWLPVSLRQVWRQWLAWRRQVWQQPFWQPVWRQVWRLLLPPVWPQVLQLAWQRF
jgi:hypothetical protein